MRIVLQHTKSGLYFCGHGVWLRDLNEAVDFGHSRSAMDFACQHQLTGVELVVAFIDSSVLETHTFPIESAPQMVAVATAA